LIAGETLLGKKNSTSENGSIFQGITASMGLKININIGNMKGKGKGACTLERERLDYMYPELAHDRGMKKKGYTKGT